MEDVKIFGAGLAGLLAARIMIDSKPVVMEKQPSLPNNHNALLRFRSGIVGDVTNIPFKKVNVSKYVLRDQGSNPIRDSAIYSLKVANVLHSRSITDTRPSERFIAPPDFIKRLASTADIRYNEDFLDWTSNLVRPHGVCISTLPMDFMMQAFKWPDKVNFSRLPGWTMRGVIRKEFDCQLNGTVYSARKNDCWYRASSTDNIVMVEGAGSLEEVLPNEDYRQEAFFNAAWHLGIPCEAFESFEVHASKYQKIVDLKGEEAESAKRFVMWLSKEHQIYSLGRFATWRSKVLLDDIVNDVRVICRLIKGQSDYINFKKA